MTVAAPQELDGLLVCVPSTDAAGAGGARAIALTAAAVHLATQPPTYPVLAVCGGSGDTTAMFVLMGDNPLATAPLSSLALTSSLLAALDGAVQAAPPSATCVPCGRGASSR
jgi:hypothetical protein